jgi:hypothetical protein
MVATAIALIGVGFGLAAAAGTLRNQPVSAGDLADRMRALVVGVLAGALCAGAVWAIAHRLGRRAPGLTTAVGALAIALGGLIGVAASAGPSSDAPIRNRDVVVDGGGSGTGGPSSGRFDPIANRDTSAEGSIVLLVGLGLAIAGAVFFSRQYELRSTPRDAVYLASELLPDEADDVDDEAIAAVLQLSLDELLLSDDPRTAIRAAYGTMLDRLAELGLGRAPAETPGQYVHRCLAARRLPEAQVSELLGLFELARFSSRTIEPDHAERARTALRALVAELRGVTA